MEKITVYSWTIWDQTGGQTKLAPRKGTAEAIESVKGTRMDETAEEIDPSRLDDNGFLRT